MEPTPTVADMMSAYAEDAVAHARSSSGVTLDYSSESVRHVEEVLEALYAAIPRGFVARLLGRGPSVDDLWTMSKMYGGYVGEVIRRAAGGEWMLDEEVVPGAGTICLRRDANRVFPPAKVHKRLTNGPEDNVWHYFRIVMESWKQ